MELIELGVEIARQRDQYLVPVRIFAGLLPGPMLFIIFILVAVIHTGYCLYFIGGLKKIGTPDKQTPGPMSIVIAATNELENLKVLIPKLFEQDYPKFEVIVSMNNTSDDSLDYLQEIRKTHDTLRIVAIDHVPEHVNAKKYALTLAIKSSSYDYILLTDADCIPSSNQWISQMAHGFGAGEADDPEIILGYSPYLKSNGLLNNIIRFETRLTGLQYLSSAANGHAYMGVGRNMAYKKDLFLKNNGFNGFLNVTGGDDDLLVNKYATNKNTAIVFTNDSIVYSKPSTGLKGYISQKIRHLSVGKFYTFKSKFFLGLFILSHFSIWLMVVLSLFYFQENKYFLMVPVMAYIPFLVAFELFGKKSGEKFRWPFTIILDLLFMFFYIFVGIRVFFTKRIAWTK